MIVDKMEDCITYNKQNKKQRNLVFVLGLQLIFEATVSKSQSLYISFLASIM